MLQTIKLNTDKVEYAWHTIHFVLMSSMETLKYLLTCYEMLKILSKNSFVIFSTPHSMTNIQIIILSSTANPLSLDLGTNGEFCL